MSISKLPFVVLATLSIHLVTTSPTKAAASTDRVRYGRWEFALLASAKLVKVTNPTATQ
jgi:hypothetical protein